MEGLREAERRKRSKKWRNRTWRLHHDNAPTHTSLLLRGCLAKYEPTVVPQTPHSPGFTLAALLLFPMLKCALKFSPFQAIEEIEEKSPMNLLAAIENVFEIWNKRWKRCMDRGGEYREGDTPY
jgi:hypothetical protein